MSTDRKPGSSRITNVQAGLIAVLLIAAASYLSVTKSLPFTGSDPVVHATFTTASNTVDTRSPVRVAGVNVGEVDTVEAGPGNTAEVTMEISDDSVLPIRTDATAEIRPRLFLEGNYYVELNPGSPGAPELEGESIPVSQTKVAVRMDEVISVLNADTRASTKRLLTGLASALDEGGPDLRRSLPYWSRGLRGIAETMEDLRGQTPGDLAAFVRDQAVVSGALADHEAELAPLVEGFRRTMSGLAAERGALSRAVRAAADTVEAAPASLAELNRALPPLRALAIDLRPALAEAPPTLRAALPFLNELDLATRPAALRGLANDLRHVVPDLIELEPRLTRLFELVSPVAECVGEKVVPVLEAELDDGPLSTGQPVWQEALSWPVGLGSAIQNFDANGPYVRLHAGTGENSIAVGDGTLGDLVGLTDSPLVGSRPRRVPGRYPPLRPDVPCETQPVTDLAAETMPAPAQQRPVGAPAVSAEEMLQTSRRVLGRTEGDPLALRRTLERLVDHGSAP
jgi:virulence factor Mce-like protein